MAMLVRAMQVLRSLPKGVLAWREVWNAVRKSKRYCHKRDVQTPNTANPGPKMPNTATKMVTIIIKIPRKSTKVGKMASPLYPWVRRRTATCIGGRTADCPSPPTSKNLANWFPGPLKVQILFAFFFGAREDQPVLLRSRATCRLSRIFRKFSKTAIDRQGTWRTD